MNRESMKELGVIRLWGHCPAKWSQMKGDAKVRFCGRCSLNVYNLSEMTADEAREVIRCREGRLCVRFYARGDGTVITRDCPGTTLLYRAWKHAWDASGLVAALAAVLLMLSTLFGDNLRRMFGQVSQTAAGDDQLARFDRHEPELRRPAPSPRRRAP